MANNYRNLDADEAFEAGGKGGRVPDGVDGKVSHKRGDVVVRDVQFTLSSKDLNFMKTCR